MKSGNGKVKAEIDGQVVKRTEQEVLPVRVQPERQVSSFLSPAATVEEAIARYEHVGKFITAVLKEGVDYGTVPGAKKPCLYKPGAEKMCAFFGLRVEMALEDKAEDWTGAEHGGEPFFYYRYHAQVRRGEVMIAEGEGSANSWEKKYRYRQADRLCSKCGKATIIKGREEFGGGWLCFAKKGGCGAKFADKAPEIIGQAVGQVKNPDPADEVNTLQKMSQKRALVCVVLIATNTSEYFTQDLEDRDHGFNNEERSQNHEPQPEPAKPTTPKQEDQAMRDAQTRHDLKKEMDGAFGKASIATPATQPISLATASAVDPERKGLLDQAQALKRAVGSDAYYGILRAGFKVAHAHELKAARLTTFVTNVEAEALTQKKWRDCLDKGRDVLGKDRFLYHLGGMGVTKVEELTPQQIKALANAMAPEVKTKQAESKGKGTTKSDTGAQTQKPMPY